MRHLPRAALGAAALLSLGGGLAAAQPNLPPERIVAHVVKPNQVEATEARIGALSLPAGFHVAKFADGLINPRMLAVGPDGAVYVTRRKVGDVVMLRDADGDGRAETRQVVANRPMMHGIFIDGSTVYLATVKEVYRAEIAGDGTFGTLRRIIDDLPGGGQHPNRTVAIGPDGMLYISVGSTCNACGETDQENATLLRARPDGSQRTIFASGLRNTIGFGWEPQSGTLYGFDHGIDWLGDHEQPEELNRIEEGKRYGWPYIFADGKVNPADPPPGGISWQEWARMSEVPVMHYTAHAAPMQMAFNTGRMFPPDYQGDAFVAMRGSWNRQPPSGYEVVRIRFEDGKPQAIEPFLTGFLTRDDQGNPAQFARPVGIAFAKDGAMLVSDDTGGAIYRIAYADQGGIASRGPSTQSALASGLAQPTLSGGSGSQMARGSDTQPVRQTTPEQLTFSLARPARPAELEVRSPAFADGAAIPLRFSEYGERISPPLAWSGLPDGTAAVAIVAEDPDVTKPKPFVHWMLANLPAGTTSLAEGLPKQPRLELPEGAVQGVNSAGAIGYVGMKPPIPEGAHHYHFQVYALDRKLDLQPGFSREQLLDAIRGHVLAAGELVGLFDASPDMVSAADPRRPGSDAAR